MSPSWNCKENTKAHNKLLHINNNETLHLENTNIQGRCKFNFSYMDFSQSAGQKFSDWSHDELIDLSEKLHHYSKESLEHWKFEKAGKKDGKILSIYNSFPAKSEFTWPTYIPSDIQWARFRLKYEVRLIGFIIPEFIARSSSTNRYLLDHNTFYVVFLDKDHNFYKK